MSTFMTLKSGKITAFLVSVILLMGCKNEKTEIHIAQEPSDTTNNTLTEVIWHIKAFHPEGKLLDVKAIGENGAIYDVKAIQD